MKIRIYRQDQPYADAESHPDGTIGLSGPDTAAAFRGTLDHYRERAGKDGEELLRWLLAKYQRSSTWTAEEIQ